MASGNFTFSTTNQYITGKIEWSSVSNGSTENSSNVTVKLYYKKSNQASASTYGTLKGNLYINGTAYSYSKSVTLACNNTYSLIASKTVKINHNSDGKKSITIDATGGISGTSFTSSNCPAKTINLDTIPRYAETTIGTLNSAQTTITIPWNSNAALNALRIYVNGTLNKALENISATSGTVTVGGLEPNTSYSIKLEGQRKDSNLWKYSDDKTITTQPITSISSNTNINFTIGNNLTLTFNNYNVKQFYLTLHVLNSSNEWVQVLSTGKMQSSSYTWSLSSHTSTLYAQTKNSNSVNIQIRCYTETGANEIKYTAKSGTMSINVSNNLPTAPSIACQNTDGTSNSVLGNKSYIPTNRTGMKLKISTLSTAKNNASIVCYMLSVKNASGAIVNSSTLSSITSAPYTVDLGNFTVAGTYTATVYAVDSRGNASNNAKATFTVLNYGAPRVTVNLARQNNFERSTSLNLTIVYSNLKISGTSKNTNISIKYRYGAVGGSYSNYVTIPLSSFTLSDKGEYTEGKLTKTITLELDQKQSYNVQVQICDSLGTPFNYDSLVGQGIPIMAQMDSGHVSVGMVPDLTKSEVLFQVGSDIMVTDSDGAKINILEFLKQVLPQELAVYKGQKSG